MKNQCVKFIVYLLLFFVPYTVFAQSKPKRDTSKDRSVVAAKAAADAKRKAAAAAEKKRKLEAQNRKRRNTYVAPKLASYVYVDGSNAPTAYLHSYSSNRSFKVNTDGKEWSVTDVPYWCRITVRTPTSFTLSVDSNPDHNTRNSWFYVKSDNVSTRVELTQNESPINATYEMNYASIEHNYQYGFSQYLRVRANLTISGARGVKCLVVAFVKDEKGNPIKGSSAFPNNRLSSTNEVYAATEVTPTSESPYTCNVVIDLPNNAMSLEKKRNKLICYLRVFIPKVSSYLENNSKYEMNFSAKKKRGFITTKRRK